ncbi:MAG: flagellar filament outer layer protein FlaA [Treponemataceae bacterium]
MKKNFILVAMAFLLVGTLAVGEEAVIIDFTQLSADIIMGADGNMTQNRRTVMDYSANAGDTFTDEQKGLMKSSLSFKNWEVVLNSSARSVSNVTLSQVVGAPVSASARVPFAGSEVLGVRVVFPSGSVNANARIVPPFEIPASEPMSQVSPEGVIEAPTDEEKASGVMRFEEGYGLVRNVGTIKSISVTTMGMNFPHGLYVLLKDQYGVERRYFMGYLSFDGWKELKWNNPAYIQEIRAREIRIYPIYPVSLPYVKFIGFQVTRDAASIGDDFIGYFKDVKIIYDKAVLNTERDIADEDVWGIMKEREIYRQNIEMSSFGQKQVDRFMEQQRQATETGTTSSIRPPADGQGTTQQAAPVVE